MRPLPLLLAVPLLALPALGHSQVRRCELADGGTVYTDRRCDTLGGRERLPSASTPQLRSYRPACPRTLRDLAYEVTAAVQARDVNRLAGVYLWSGLGTREGYALMDRLQRVVDRPLVDLQPIWPGNQDEAYYATTAPTAPPIGLRLEQTSPRGTTPIRAVFGLRRHLDCWWIVEGGARRAPAPPATVEAQEADTAPGVPPVD